jgi:hypothetical protein
MAWLGKFFGYLERFLDTGLLLRIGVTVLTG